MPPNIVLKKSMWNAWGKDLNYRQRFFRITCNLKYCMQFVKKKRIAKMIFAEKFFSVIVKAFCTFIF